jgi:hypothetical protein
MTKKNRGILSAHGSFPFFNGHEFPRQTLLIKLKKLIKTAFLKEIFSNIFPLPFARGI